MVQILCKLYDIYHAVETPAGLLFRFNSIFNANRSFIYKFSGKNDD